MWLTVISSPLLTSLDTEKRRERYQTFPGSIREPRSPGTAAGGGRSWWAGRRGPGRARPAPGQHLRGRVRRPCHGVFLAGAQVPVPGRDEQGVQPLPGSRHSRRLAVFWPVDLPVPAFAPQRVAAVRQQPCEYQCLIPRFSESPGLAHSDRRPPPMPPTDAVISGWISPAANRVRFAADRPLCPKMDGKMTP